MNRTLIIISLGCVSINLCYVIKNKIEKYNKTKYIENYYNPIKTNSDIVKEYEKKEAELSDFERTKRHNDYLYMCAFIDRFRYK